MRGFLETLWFFIKGNITLRLSNGGGVGLNWIRIEPDTRIYEIALAEKVISRKTELLPEFGNVKLEDMFYSSPSVRKYDWIARFVLWGLETLRTVVRGSRKNGK